MPDRDFNKGKKYDGSEAGSPAELQIIVPLFKNFKTVKPTV